jgi:protein-disulfide isomerase
MAKRKRTARRARREEKKTNWWLIGGIILIGIAGLAVLLVLSQQEAESQSLVDYCTDNPENCVTKGSPDAKVTILEVSDYGCSHCRDFNLQTAGLIEDRYVTPGEVQWIVFPFALSTQTVPAASAALCAGDQGRFFEFHRRMFDLQGSPQALTPDGYLQAARDLGLDADSFNSCLVDGVYDDVVQENIRAANAANVRATPTFFVNDKMLEGNHPLTDFQQEIASLISASDAN